MTSEEIAAFVFLDIAVIIMVARIMGALFKRVRQPPVVGEIIGGILLGPTLLGALPGSLDTDLFPLEVRPHLGTVAQLGLIIFMFIVGMELDLALIRGKERVAAVISVSSIILPFGLGVLLALGLHGTYDLVAAEGGAGPLEEVELLPFALFIGASMSITAFPVLARILNDRGMYRTQIGALTLASAAVDDVLAWSLLAVVLAVVASTSAWDLPRILLESVAFVAVMFVFVRPLLARLAGWHRREGRLTPNMLAVVVAGFLVSAYVTSEIGIHAIFGAFTFGAVMPREETHALFREILERLENVSVLILLPVFFVATGLNVDVTGIGLGGAATLALILLVACAGKLIGATVGARSQGIPTRKALAVGTLMNTRGLTELVILGVGREFGILHDDLFTLLVVMAVFTTVITEPLLRVVYPDRLLNQDVADAQRAALGLPEAYRVIVLVGDRERDDQLVDLAADVIGDEQPSELVLSRFDAFPATVELGSGLQGQLADMATAMDEMRATTARVEARGIRATTFSQYSNDVAGDVIAQVRALDANVLMLAVPADGTGDLADAVPAIVAEAAADLVVVTGLPGAEATPVALRGGGAGDDAGAVEVATRLARSRDRRLVLLERDEGDRRAGQRVSALRDLLDRAGVAATIARPDGAVVVVSPLAAGEWERRERAGEPAGVELHVRTRPGFDRTTIDELVESWEERPAGEPAATTGGDHP